MPVEFTVPGEPVAKGRPRFARIKGFVRTFTPQKSARFEERVRLCAINAGAKPIDGPGVRIYGRCIMTDLLSRLSGLAEKATKGPWLAEEWRILANNEYRSLIAEVSSWHLGGGAFPEQAKANYELIVSLRNSLDALLSRIEAADAMEEAARALMNESSGLRAFEDEVRSAISNTNWRCIMDRVEQTRAALAAYSAAKGVS